MDNQAFKQQQYNQPHPHPQSYGQGPPPQYGQQYAPQYAQPMHHSSSNVTVVTAGLQPTVIVPVNITERDWTVPAILATLFCFLPTGICAIIAAVNARSLFQAGDHEGGRASNAWARGLTITSIVLGTVLISIIIGLYIWVWSVATSFNNY